MDGNKIEGGELDLEVERWEGNTGHIRELEEKDPPKVSSHAIAGTLAPQTTRVRGMIGKHPVILLIDLGSTHNFLHPIMARSRVIHPKNMEASKPWSPMEKNSPAQIFVKWYYSPFTNFLFVPISIS